ncbi:Similar to cki-1: Cyclin-dependent kinase inhibitor 1 (Caenorhabditis elegans) [Cotesia congregata]|uniref:Similar to cki-1: Cyclin-dependent kinase inhibitor 1 (Caenorhabditis elegans) n=1 Tax=Cotesia congregata TaxID=51543 RepID=A0A8J2MYN9_COTCN|nr:Similar to cki-1: Cyclin-dependent kinase inhibitor 1 (Caenorhabditis elegans) [Cotesia congregata]
MSARVMNPAMMTESRKLGGAVGGGGSGGRVVPTRAELAKVRRDLFGPVDHEAARAFVERELKAQSVLDAERWGFDFSLGLPRNTSARYDWEVVSNEEVVPEPYALRGMPYLRKNAPSTPRKTNERSVSSANRRSTSLSPMNMDSGRPKAERTPPQEPRVPEIGEPEDEFRGECAKKSCVIPEPTTPVLPTSARKQSSITDFMKTRKRTSNSSTKKSSIEPPEKLPRNAGQIRS